MGSCVHDYFSGELAWERKKAGSVGETKSKELRTRGGGFVESREKHAFLKGVLSVPSASRGVGGLAGFCKKLTKGFWK